MARWTGDPGITAVLKGADAWRERCFTASMSILTDRPLWTLSNLNDLLTRFTGNPISGSRDFLDKLSEQLKDAPAEIPQLAAEVLWFLNLFPHPGTMKAETKREQIKTVWQWSGEDVPASPFLNDDTLGGVGNPGVDCR